DDNLDAGGLGRCRKPVLAVMDHDAGDLDPMRLEHVQGRHPEMTGTNERNPHDHPSQSRHKIPRRYHEAGLCNLTRAKGGGLSTGHVKDRRWHANGLWTRERMERRASYSETQCCSRSSQPLMMCHLSRPLDWKSRRSDLLSCNSKKNFSVSRPVARLG